MDRRSLADRVLPRPAQNTARIHKFGKHSILGSSKQPLVPPGLARCFRSTLSFQYSEDVVNERDCCTFLSQIFVR
jgi:hypothetical protein